MKVNESTIPTVSLNDIDRIIDLVELYQVEDTDMGVGLRGMYKSQLHRVNLSQSHVWDNHSRTNMRLCGTCAVEVVHDWYSASRDDVETGLRRAKIASAYGDSDIIALVIGKPQNGAEDMHEIILSDRDNPTGGARVIAYVQINN